MTADEAITIIDENTRGRTRYEDQHDFLDEVLVKEIRELRQKCSSLEEELSQRVDDDYDDDDWENCYDLDDLDDDDYDYDDGDDLDDFNNDF